MDRARVARECVRIEQRGGNVREYLKSLGCVSVWGTWYRLQREELGRHPNEITYGYARTDYEEKEIDDMGSAKLNEMDRAECVRIALGGGNPLDFIESRGIVKASQAWAKIKNRLHDEDPETWAKLPKRLESRGGVFGRKPKQEAYCTTADPVPAEVTEEATVPEITKPINYLGYNVTAVESAEFGEFHRKGDYVDWETRDGDTVCMTIPEWRELADRLSMIFGILGVKL